MKATVTVQGKKKEERNATLQQCIAAIQMPPLPSYFSRRPIIASGENNKLSILRSYHKSKQTRIAYFTAAANSIRGAMGCLPAEGQMAGRRETAHGRGKWGGEEKRKKRAVLYFLLSAPPIKRWKDTGNVERRVLWGWGGKEEQGISCSAIWYMKYNIRPMQWHNGSARVTKMWESIQI